MSKSTPASQHRRVTGKLILSRGTGGGYIGDRSA
jgi:hypothetical protein